MHVLDEGEVMDRFLYAELIEDWFPERLGQCKYVVQDFERALRCEEPLLAFENIGVIEFNVVHYDNFRHIMNKF